LSAVRLRAEVLLQVPQLRAHLCRHDVQEVVTDHDNGKK
jgi:hypothetical protein